MGSNNESQGAMQIKLGLAPMEGVTDFATRLWLTQTSRPDFTTTPFLRVTKDYPAKRIPANFLPEIQLSKEHGIVPCIPQLMASDEDDLIRIAQYFLDFVPFVDINCGYPSPTVVGHGAGSQLLSNPRRFSDYLNRIVGALGAKRMSVKMRVGFDSVSEFPRLLEVLAPLPLARLTVHGRTRADKYTGWARWSLIEEAAKSLPYPVFGSGDILDEKGLLQRLTEAPHVAGVLVGRGALRDPWIFERLRGNAMMVDPQLFSSRLKQFVLLQELQAQHWTQLLAAVKAGIFAERCSLGDKPSDELYEQQMSQLGCFLRDEGIELKALDPRSWAMSRVSVARGKMLWNYLRSGLPIDSNLSQRILRAADWREFLDALDHAMELFEEDEFVIRHRPDWDWVFAGGGKSSQQSAPNIF